MEHLYKFRSNIFLTGILTAIIIFTSTWKAIAIDAPRNLFYTSLTTGSDTTRPPKIPDRLKPLPHFTSDTSQLPGKDSARFRAADSIDRLTGDTLRPVIRDTIVNKTDTFSLKLSKDSLDAPLKYAAEDSAVVLIQDKKIILYGKTRTEYKDILLTAPKVEVDQTTQVVTAVNSRDSTGAVIETAYFKSGETDFTSDTIRYNFKTRVGLTMNTYTQQGEFVIIGDRSKKVDDNVTYIQGVRFSTCLLDEPHFAFATPKMKLINKKLAVSGPAHLEFEGVPIPIYIPFGFYPLSQGRHSGFLPPRFSTVENLGLGLEGMGYYKVLSEYWDVRTFGDIYSYGQWSINVNPTYRKRYRYNGSFNLSYLSSKQNFKGDPDFSKTKNYAVTWSHAVDSRARPGTNFSASVNVRSTRYNQLIPGDPNLNFQNQLGSSITYSKTWIGKPYNLTLSANHNQNNETRLVNVSLPDAGFTVSTLYPFQRATMAGTPRWYEKLGIGYNGNFRNQFSFYDTAFRLARVIDTLQWGAQHNFPLTLSLPPILNGAVIVSPSVNYSQVWIAQKSRRTWNTLTQKSDTVITKGFFTDHQLGFALSFNTAVFGTYNFKNSRILAIRHVIRPGISLNYRPDLSKGNFYTDTLSPGFAQQFSVFSGGLYQGFSPGETGGISFQLDNNIEMKVRSRTDTSNDGIKKIRILEGYGFNGGYNFLRDSMKLDVFNLYLRTTLFEKISITANSFLDPYQKNERGQSIDRYAWQEGKFNLGRLTSGSVSISTNFRSKPKDEKKDEERKKQQEELLNDPALIGDQRALLEYARRNPAEFVDFNVPWQVSLSYSLYFSSQLKPDLTGYETKVNSNVNFSGSFNLTPKWNFSTGGYFSFDTKKLETFQMSINREMHCWQLSINVVPVGLYRSFNFSISPKASVLQDLKINRTRFFSY